MSDGTALPLCANRRHRGTAIRSPSSAHASRSRQGNLGGTSVDPGFQAGVLATIVEPRPVLGTSSDKGGRKPTEGTAPRLACGALP